MADIVSKQRRSEVMAAVRSYGNRATELRLVALLRRQGITGWRRRQNLFGKPDFVFRRQRVALFVDGCFWHGCSRCYRRPATRRSYWDAKVQGNKQRDRLVVRILGQTGWGVLRIWEHELARRHEPRMVRRIRRALAGQA